MRLKVAAGRKWMSQVFAGSLLLGGLCGATAAELQGAGAVLQAARAAESQAPADKRKPVKDIAEINQFVESVRAKTGNFHQLAPGEAARQWYQLLVEFLKLADQSDMSEFSWSMSQSLYTDMFVHIPGPDSWPELQRLVEKNAAGLTPRRQALLQILFARLREDDSGVSAGLDSLKKALAEDGKKPGVMHKYESLERQLRHAGSTTGSAVDRFQAKMATLRSMPQGVGLWLSIPDLLAVTDEATARKLLQEAIALPDTELQFDSANKTLDLAKQVALENIGKLKKPRWDLVSSLNSLPLYEAMEKKFVKKAAAKKPASNDPADALLRLFGGSQTEHTEPELDYDSDKVKAQVYHYLDLILAGREAEADEVFVYSNSFFNSLRSAVESNSYQLPESVYRNLLDKLDDRAVNFEDLWVSAENLARQNHDLPAYAERLKTAIEGSPKAAAKARLLHRLGQVYFELNRPDDAVHWLLKVADKSDEATNHYSGDEALRLVFKAGKALKRQDYVDQALEALQKQPEKEPGFSFLGDFSRQEILFEALLDQQRLAEAEEAIRNSLISALAEKDAAPEKLSGQLYWLVRIYSKAGRSADIMELLDRAPWWGRADLNGVISTADVSFSMAVAKAFNAVGRGPEAEKLLKKTILKNPSADTAYDLLTSLTGTASIPWLEKLSTRDPFEERPFIWKAVVLHRAGDLKGAEEAARHAMKVDPTDGEQPKGQRLLSYKVLADILADAGQTSEAHTLKRIVAAVRLAEQGDELNEIGLAQQAVEVYRQASADFSDAYCVEWRLARRLQEQGDEEGARRHYEKAFQMMPNQFGRLANLCFGCEEVFTAGLSQSVAERVLQQIASEPDPKPIVFDLLGQLRQAQGDYVDAARYFRKAATLDPSYFDAWQHLRGIADEAFLSPEEKKAVAVRLVELDPFLQHYQAISDDVPPALLWRAGERNREWGLEQMQDLYPLKASQERLRYNLQRSKNYYVIRERLGFNQGTWRGPAMHLTEVRWFRDVVDLLDPTEIRHQR